MQWSWRLLVTSYPFSASSISLQSPLDLLPTPKLNFITWACNLDFEFELVAATRPVASFMDHEGDRTRAGREIRSSSTSIEEWCS